MIRTALVTGSTSGIGLGVAKQFAMRGLNVVLNGFGDPAPALQEIRAIGASKGVQCAHVDADLSKPEECRRLIAEAAAQFQLGGDTRIDVLVNNAGIQHVAPIAEFPEREWDKIIDINLNSVFHCSKAVLPYMRRHQFGRIVHIASVHGLVGSANKSAYVAAKHGVIGFSKVLALETAKENITSNCVCPGWVLTPLVEKQIEAKAQQDRVSYAAAMETLIGEKMPSGRPASVEEIAAAVCYFADEMNVSTRGVALNIDGGWIAH
jgi:3-hydroxybutyrate dehydrogenase